jgi:hypothetical protein
VYKYITGALCEQIRGAVQFANREWASVIQHGGVCVLNFWPRDLLPWPIWVPFALDSSDSDHSAAARTSEPQCSR